MKKALTLFALIASTSCAFAYVHLETSTSSESMKDFGWSSSTIELVQTAKRNSNSNTAEIKPISLMKPGTETWENSSGWDKFKYYYGELRYYWDPMAENPHFGEGSIDFGNDYECL